MAILNPTSWERLLDARGRPYFLWDTDMTLEEFLEKLRGPDAEVAACCLGRLMRQAKPDDVFLFVSPSEIEARWPATSPYLGKSREFWRWLLDTWKVSGRAGR